MTYANTQDGPMAFVFEYDSPIDGRQPVFVVGAGTEQIDLTFTPLEDEFSIEVATGETFTLSIDLFGADCRGSETDFETMVEVTVTPIAPAPE